MPELNLLEVFKYALTSLGSSKVLVLVLLEIAILLVAIIFNELMDKKLVKRFSIITGVVVLAFYLVNYIQTIKVFIDNVSTRLIELIYFPTTLEFMVVIITSIIIMTITLTNKKSNKYIKFINSFLAIIESFLFLSIIEYINTNNIAFDEFSVFTNPNMMSLYELAMGLFVAWLLGLVIYKIDLIVINRINNEEISDAKTIGNIKIVDDDLELPKLKAN